METFGNNFSKANKQVISKSINLRDTVLLFCVSEANIQAVLYVHLGHHELYTTDIKKLDSI